MLTSDWIIALVVLLVVAAVLVFSFGDVFSEVIEIFSVGPVSESGILLPAIVGVLGSFLLYLKREHDRRERLKLALTAELQELSTLAELPARLYDLDKPPTKERIPPDAVPPADALPTLVYENNLQSLSRLDGELVQDIVSFYSLLLRHKGTISMIQEEDHQDAETHVLPMSEHKDLFDDVGDLRRKRRRLLNHLED